LHTDFVKDKWFLGTSIFIIVLAVFLAVIVAYPGMFNHVNLNTNKSGTSTVVQSSLYIIKLKNLSYENYYLKNGNLYQTVPIEIVKNISISANRSTVSVNETLNLSLIYTGIFNFNIYNSSSFVKGTIDIQYFGYYENNTNGMLVYNNKPNATKYFVSIATPKAFAPPGMPENTALGMEVYIKPTAFAANKTWVFCGGYFEAFANNTNWVSTFNNVTYTKEAISNSSIINIISSRCIRVNVHG